MPYFLNYNYIDFRLINFLIALWLYLNTTRYRQNNFAEILYILSSHIKIFQMQYRFKDVRFTSYAKNQLPDACSCSFLKSTLPICVRGKLSTFSTIFGTLYFKRFAPIYSLRPSIYLSSATTPSLTII